MHSIIVGTREALRAVPKAIREAAYGLGATLTTLGAASLFVYWVHVELVYGGVAIPIKHRLPLVCAQRPGLGALLALKAGRWRR
mgnify:CR=1 FL=1